MKKAILMMTCLCLALTLKAQKVTLPKDFTYTINPSHGDSLLASFQIEESYMYADNSQFKVGDSKLLAKIHQSISAMLSAQVLSAMGDAYIKLKNITKDAEESKKAFILGLTQNPNQPPNYSGTKKDDYQAGINNNKP